MKIVYQKELVRVLRRKPRHVGDDATYWVQTRRTPVTTLWWDTFPEDKAAYQEPFDTLEQAIQFIKDHV